MQPADCTRCLSAAWLQVVTITKQEASAAAVGGVYALLFLLSGTLMAVGTPVISALGLGPFLSMMATLFFCCAFAAFVHIIRSCSDAPKLESPPTGAGRLGSVAFVRSAYVVLTTTFKQPPVVAEAAAPCDFVKSDGGPRDQTCCKEIGPRSDIKACADGSRARPDVRADKDVGSTHDAMV